MRRSMSDSKYLIDNERIRSLLFHIAVFLRAAGMTDVAAAKLFRTVYRQSARVKNIRRFHRIRSSAHYENIVALWMRDQRFVDKAGHPRALSTAGQFGFATLVRSVNRSLDPKAVLAVFKRYRTIRRAKGGLYELLTPYFAVSTPKSAAFEPYAHFICEASTTFGRMLIHSRSKAMQPFWRMVDSNRLSEIGSRRFMAFVRDRSQTFLEELDDWLEANACRSALRGSKRQRARVGLGMFSIHSGFKDWRQ